MAHVTEVVFMPPESSMKDEKQRKRAMSIRIAQFSELKRISSVGHPLIKRGLRPFKNVCHDWCSFPAGASLDRLIEYRDNIEHLISSAAQRACY